jgi:hypothetical protein
MVIGGPDEWILGGFPLNGRALLRKDAYFFEISICSLIKTLMYPPCLRGKIHCHGNTEVLKHVDKLFA